MSAGYFVDVRLYENVGDILNERSNFSDRKKISPEIVTEIEMYVDID